MNTSNHVYLSARACRWWYVPAVIAGLLSGCVDDATAPALRPAGDLASVTTGSDEPAGPDLVVPPRFDLDLDVAGSLKPGHPIHLSVRGSAHYATEDVQVRLILPEVAAAKRSNWEVVKVPVGEELQPEMSIRKSFQNGERFHGKVTVTIPEPGYYHLIATIIQRSEERTVDDRGHVVGSGAGRDVWLWIDEHGGRMTDQFDPSLFPAGTRAVRGPRGSEKKAPRIRDGDAVITCSITPEFGEVSYSVATSGCPLPPDSTKIGITPPPAPNATTAATVTYNDMGAGGVTRSLSGARLLWTVRNSTTGATVTTGSGYTGASGTGPVIDCMGATSERLIEVIVQTVNPRTEVINYTSPLPDRTRVGTFFGACGGNIALAAQSEQAHLFMNVNKNYDAHQRVFGSVPTTMRAGMYPQSGYGSRYDWGARDVRIEPGWNHIWGEQGVMVVTHEWGHLWQDQYLFKSPDTNGLRRFYNGSCPNPHPPGEYTNFGCALGEAFADWYAVVLRESDLPGWRTDLETNRLFEFYCGSKCTDDGSVVQGAVHALLWDMYDANGNEQHDRIQVPAQTITNSIKDCQVSANRVDYYGFTGIDHLIWCMERRFPYQVTLRKNNGVDTVATFFNTRSRNAWANDARGVPVANFSDDFRRLWLVNLYSERPYVGRTGGIFRTATPIPDDPIITDPIEPAPRDPTCTLRFGCPVSY
ncbi:hypothetical protein [Longimicrobium terrae]|uniref:Uncharacterized protein n=1 Tax=Longimicrobium terrae TaxID=1639882 RepID=A0A841GUP2_9BACT|nr:hypothetical protein [Longimicrobium terrae]MBB4634347.1 hypothetical protein [Longimicrobium terrae]MBB6068763.1 hypothetical protein [Longimicrobium terrae]NNC27948.1 hypothetical protein [Longimicrobium terrae]